VAAPCRLTAGQIREIETLSVEIAQAIRLTGLMDVEVILHEGRFKVLEIDARFPSQTPRASMRPQGATCSTCWPASSFRNTAPVGGVRDPRGAILEHIRVTTRAIFVEGEHIMADAGPLERVPGFFGADEAITSCREGAPVWVATLIVTAATRQLAVKKNATGCYSRFSDASKLRRIVDRGQEYTA
jgi:pyrrolysine biosynthesis protein PylC